MNSAGAAFNHEHNIFDFPVNQVSSSMPLLLPLTSRISWRSEISSSKNTSYFYRSTYDGSIFSAAEENLPPMLYGNYVFSKIVRQKQRAAHYMRIHKHRLPIAFNHYLHHMASQFYLRKRMNRRRRITITSPFNH